VMWVAWVFATLCRLVWFATDGVVSSGSHRIGDYIPSNNDAISWAYLLA
jgi:hypothetical protein